MRLALLCFLLPSALVSAQTPPATPTLSGFPSPDHIGAAHTVTVTITNGSGATLTGYTGTITFSSSDRNAALPAPYTFQLSDQGSHAFSLALNTGGTHTLTASTADGSSGSQTGIVVDDFVWVVNNTGTLTKLDETGAVVLAQVGSSQNTASTAAVAFDNAGGVWSVNSGSSSLLSASKTSANLTTYTSGGLNYPVSLAIDGAGAVWVADTSNAISVFANSGAVLSYPIPYQSTSGYRPSALDSPSSLAIDRSGSVWIANAGNATITKVIGAATPVVTPTASAIANHALGTRP